ncbi:MAG: hypothetical protein E6G02_06035 [Actinobacteria bacterium]|nr:MAG: hypothetical protein E6G02_06035 [Actinomycetota bacterium]
MHDPSRFAVALALTALALSGCAGHRARARPSLLVDGTRAPALPEVLASLGKGAVMSRVRVLPAARLDPRGRACVEGFRHEFGVSSRTIVVERTGAFGASITFVSPHRRVVLGCDRTAQPSPSGVWCARSVGRLFDGRLHDGRVDILCVGPSGGRVGFAWVEPTRRARWIVVAQPSGAEVEEIAAGLPVRIATRDVDSAASSATFAVAEYDSAGSEVARYGLRARVAG